MDNNEIIVELTEMKQKMISLIETAEQIGNIEIKLNPPKRKVSNKIKVVIGVLVFLMFAKIGDILGVYGTTMHSFVTLVFTVFISTVLTDRFYNFLLNAGNYKDDLIYEFNQLETKWNELVQEIYSAELIPPKYINPEYLDYLIECIKYKRADNLIKALDLLDLEIRHNESLEMMGNIQNTINENSVKLFEAVQSMEDKLSTTNDYLRGIRKDVSWTAYNTSILRPRSYIGKAIDDTLRI